MSYTRIASIVPLLLILAFSGCSRLTTDYGKSSGRIGRTSLNGFGALRQTYENEGFKCRDASRLTHRVMLSDTIVWTPQLMSQIDTEPTKWFDRWLSTGNKTLVYIVPDSGSEIDYWSDAAKLAPPKQRLEYRKQTAKAINQQMTWRLGRTSVQNSGWFDIKPFQDRKAIGKMTGVWVDGNWADDVRTSKEDGFAPMFELTIDDSTTTNNTTGAAANLFPGLVQTGPALPTFPVPFDTEASEETVTFHSLLKTESGLTIVSEINSDDWHDSKIIVVAGGSLLTNYAFSRSWNRQLADKLVAASKPKSNGDLSAAFVTSRWSMVPVSDGKPGIPKATGMELLTVWPISLVTMHGVMLAFVIGLALFPIFGRPRRIHVNRQRDFGDHLDAIAALMNKTGDEEFARGRIREYRKRMHGESESASDTTQLARNEETT